MCKAHKTKREGLYLLCGNTEPDKRRWEDCKAELYAVTHYFARGYAYPEPSASLHTPYVSPTKMGCMLVLRPANQLHTFRFTAMDLEPQTQT